MDKVVDLRNSKKETAKNEETSPSKFMISWTGLLYYHNPDMKAVWSVVIIFWALAVISQIFQKIISSTVLMVMIGLMVLVQAKRKHKNTGEIVLSPRGIKIGNVNHNYSGIKSFWVDYEPEHRVEELSIQLKKWYMPYIRLPIEGQDPVRLRNFLLQYIPEVQHEISLSEIIARRLGL